MHSKVYVQLYFKALYSSFNSSSKLFYAEILTAKPENSLLLKASLCIFPLTFVIEALHFATKIQWLLCTMKKKANTAC